MLCFSGAGHFRERLALATVTGRALRIDNIRAHDEQPGLRDYEAGLLRLLEKLTDGTIIEINETGKYPVFERISLNTPATRVLLFPLQAQLCVTSQGSFRGGPTWCTTVAHHAV